MTSEISEIVRFLEQTPPFQFLEEEQLAKLSRHIEVRYAKAGSGIIEAGQKNDWLFVMRSGSVELRLADEELTARLGAGSTFAYPSLLRGGEVRNSTFAIEDTLLYAIPGEQFHELRRSSPAFREFFAEDESARIKHALAKRRENSSFAMTSKPIGELVGRATPIACDMDSTIRQAVAIMDEHNVSTLAICDDGQLRGIFTDKDLRSRVVAANLSLEASISEAMTEGPRTLTTNSTVAEAMALMASGGFRHIPLIDQAGQLAGILSATDILSAIGNNAIDTGMMIAKARNEQELVEAAQGIPDGFAKMVASGVDASHVMHFTSALGEAVHRKAAELTEQELGPPPCRYAFVAFGSLAREEQLVGSDQDNGLVIEDGIDPDGEAYFEAFGARISDILNASGFVYCKGGIMAKNADQRRTLKGWCDRYADWISRPNEDRILRVTIFFDMRHIFGDPKLTKALHDETVALFKDSPLFVSYLARDALRSKVPLGIFRNLVLEKSEDGQKVFNAKRQAIMPIIDIARTNALAAGIGEVGTLERLRALAETGKMNREDAQSLEDALLLVNEMRIEHQARQIELGQTPDNLIAPSDLSPLERDYLKDAFSVIRDGLDSLRRNFAGGIA
jgi:CBS domain-containing protein